MDELIAGKISFSEAENESKQCKSLNAVKDAYMKEVQLKSWDEVEDVIKNIGDQPLDSEGNEMVAIHYSFSQHVCSGVRCGNTKACEEVSNPNLTNSVLVMHEVHSYLQKYRPLSFALPIYSTKLNASVSQPTSDSHAVKPFIEIVDICDMPLVQDSPAPAQLQAIVAVIVKQTGSIIHSSPILSSSASSDLKHFTSLIEEPSYQLKFPHPSLTHEECQEHHDDFMHSAFVSNNKVHPITCYLNKLGQRGRCNIDSSSAPSYEYNFIIPHEEQHQRKGDVNQSCTCANQNFPPNQDHHNVTDTPMAATTNSTIGPNLPTHNIMHFVPRSKGNPFKRYFFICLLLLFIMPCGQAMNEADIQLIFSNASTIASAHKSTTALEPLQRIHDQASSATISEMKHVSSLPPVLILQLILMRQRHPRKRIDTQKEKPVNSTAMMVHPQFSLSLSKDLTVVPHQRITTCESISLLDNNPPNISLLLLNVMLDQYAIEQDRHQCLPSSHQHVILQCTLIHPHEVTCPMQEHNSVLRFELLIFSATLNRSSLNIMPTLIELIGILIAVLYMIKLVRHLVSDTDHENEFQRPIEVVEAPFIYDQGPFQHREYNVHHSSNRNGVNHDSVGVLVEPHDDSLVGPDNQRYPPSADAVCKWLSFFQLL